MDPTHIKALAHEAEAWYRFNDSIRFYHNWKHARDVVRRLYDMREPSDEVLLAAYWHDAVYVPKAANGANEECSAAALGVAARQFKDKATLQSVVDAQMMIKSTTVKDHLTSGKIVGDLAKLLDCDLGSLASPYDEFLNIQKNIIKEQGGTVEENTVDSQNFLKQFLECREYIYHTEYGREHWEDIAKSNIKRYLKG